MEIIKLSSEKLNLVAPLVAAFRVVLKSYKGITSTPDVREGKEELEEYLQAGFPTFFAMTDGKCVGYIVCRGDCPTVWVESIYVLDAYRRMDIASALLRQAESLAKEYGEDTVFNYVHPNNDGMIAFLRKHGYTVLNLIEIRRPFTNEILKTKIQVGNNSFDY